MFVHETHSYYIMLDIKVSTGLDSQCLSKKKSYVDKTLINIGAETVGSTVAVWMLNEVMYSSAEDVFDIINSEVIRLVSSDNSIPKEEKSKYLLKSDTDRVNISEYTPENHYVF